jgi:hypothetical protein
MSETANAATGAPQEAPMKMEPQAEHLWLRKLIGNWTYEAECIMKPGDPPVKSGGSETVRAFGDLWVVAEGRGEMPGCGVATTLMALGYDPARKRFVGSWIGSMMANLWIYEAVMDPSGNKLPLEAEGPSMTAEGRAKYRDVIEFKSDNERTLTSQMLVEDGQWITFMTATYRKSGGA